MAASHALKRWAMPAPIALATAGAASFLCAMMLESAGKLDGSHLQGRLVYGLSSMTLVLGVAAAERAEALTVPRVLRRLGAASYSIYLFQFLFIGLTWQVLLVTGAASLTNSVLLFAILAGAALAGGLAASRLVERPLLALFRRKPGGRAASREPGGPRI